MEKELAPIMHNRPLLKLSLLLTGSMTVLAGAGIAAAIPEIQENFASHKNAEFFCKMMLSVPALFIALLAPFAGQIIDSFGRKALLIVSLIVYAVAGTSGFYLSDIISLLIGRALLGVAVAGIMTINVTLIGDYFHGSERSRFMGWQGAFMALGGVLFVSVGGLLADFSWRMPFLVYAFSIIVLILTIIYIYEPDIKNRKTQTPPGKAHMPPGKVKKNFKKYGIIYSTAFVGMLFFYMIPTQIPFLLARSGQISNTSIGYSISLAILAGAVLSANYEKIKRRFNYYQIYAITFFLIGTGFLVISFSHSYSAILTGLIVAGFGTGLFMPNTNLWLISLASPNHRGRLVGILNLFVYSGQFLSPILAYPLIQWQSINFLFGICSLFISFLTVFFLLQKKQSFQAPG